jgi:hypothetical protein
MEFEEDNQLDINYHKSQRNANYFGAGLAGLGFVGGLGTSLIVAFSSNPILYEGHNVSPYVSLGAFIAGASSIVGVLKSLSDVFKHDAEIKSIEGRSSEVED